MQIYWCIRPICPVGSVRLPTITNNSMNSQKTPGKRPATPRKEYPRYQGPSLKEKAKRETNQWGEGSEGGIIPASRLLEQGPGFLTIPVHPSFPSHTPPSPPSPPVNRALGSQQVDPRAREGGEGKERRGGRGVTWITAEGQLWERPLGGWTGNTYLAKPRW